VSRRPEALSAACWASPSVSPIDLRDAARHLNFDILSTVILSIVLPVSFAT
jgi:hypothetical protein